MKIRVLDEQTINQIAAGEVIENPASVVKELVENAIDAGSTDICVEIQGGGRQLIRVTDDGCGMERDDALLCLERHATSKLRDIEDIHSLATMGFRGEAIPSIASISKFSLLTSTGHSEKGTLVSVDGGKVLECSPAVRGKGTTLEVKSLFFNVPARKKFQRSPTYDSNEVLKMISGLALGNPQIKFQLIEDRKSVLSANLFPSLDFMGQLKERIKTILGSEFHSGLCPLDYEKEGIRLQGFVGLPAFTRHNRTGQYLFINNRAVVSPLVNYAIREGYGTTLAENRHPIYVLHLQVPGSIIDVNVHPQKREVRLRQSEIIKEVIQEGINKGLQGTRVSYEKDSHPFPAPVKPAFTYQPFDSKAFEPMYVSEPRPQEIYVKKKEVPKVIATMPGFLILEPSEEGFCVIDQRAAHSRILFERLLKNECRIESQALLIPHTMELNTGETRILKEHLSLFKKIGFEVEEFGQNSFIVRSVPILFNVNEIERVIQDVLHSLTEFGTTNVSEHEREKQLAQASSRASLSKKKKLTLFEAQNLLSQLMECQNPKQCPLGKNIITEFIIDHGNLSQKTEKNSR